MKKKFFYSATDIFYATALCIATLGIIGMTVR